MVDSEKSGIHPLILIIVISLVIFILVYLLCSYLNYSPSSPLGKITPRIPTDAIGVGVSLPVRTYKNVNNI